MALITQLDISFAGSFQARLAVGMDPGDSSPTDPYGTYGKKSGGVGATCAYQEKPFDRIIRLSKPVDLRNARIDPWEDATVKSVQMDSGKGFKPAPPGNPFLGQVVSLGSAAKFIEGEGYEIDGLMLSVGPFLTAKPAGVVSSSYKNDAKAEAEYRIKKTVLFTTSQLDPVRARALRELSATSFESWRVIFTSIGLFDFFLERQSVNFSARFSDGSALDSPANYLWYANLRFSRWDPDALGGQLSGAVGAVHKSVLQAGAKVMASVFASLMPRWLW